MPRQIRIPITQKWLMLLLISISVSIILMIAVFEWQQSEVTGLREQNLDFHLHSLVNIANAERELAYINRITSDAGQTGGPPAGLDKSVVTVDYAVHLYSLERELAELDRLYANLPDDATIARVTRAVSQQFETLSSLIHGDRDSGPISDPAVISDSLQLSLEQLSRLHTIMLEKKDTEYGELIRNTNRINITVLAILLVALAIAATISSRRINRAFKLLGRSEQQLGQLNAQLEERVQQRTSELQAAQEKLVRKERLATLGQLTATVAHELRNPMGTIRNTVYSLANKVTRTDDRITTLLERIDRNVLRCDRIIAELLDFSKEPVFQKEPVILETWLEKVLDEYDLPQEIRLTRQLAGNTAVTADPLALERAVINVLDNAAQALGQSTDVSGLIEISIDQTNDRAGIIISDNGPGIAEDLRQQVFEPLYSTKTFGVGLGMPTVKRILEAHGGSVELGAGTDGGARVGLWLPLETGQVV